MMPTDGNPNYGVVPSPDTGAYPDDVLPALRAYAELTHTITIRTCDLLVMSRANLVSDRLMRLPRRLWSRSTRRRRRIRLD